MASSIGGKRKEGNGSSDYSKYVGLFEAKVISINPDAEEYKDLIGMELKEDSKALEYLGTSKEDNTTLRVDVWLEELKDGHKFKATFFLEDKEKTNKDETKVQYINTIGICSWASDPNDLPDWFMKRDYRPAYVGEEDLYSFLRTWLGNLDYRDVETVLELEWKKLMRGNLKDLKAQIDGEWCTNIISLATIKSVVKGDETKEYQNIYTKYFLPAYTLKQFKMVDYSREDILAKLRSKKSSDLKAHEKFVINVTGEYGCKDFYTLRELTEYDAALNIVASDAAMIEEDSPNF